MVAKKKMSKKPAQKKTAKKEQEKVVPKILKKVAKKKVTKKTAAKKTLSGKRTLAKKTSSAKGRGKGKTAEPGSCGVTVHIGGQKPSLALAPGVILSRPTVKKKKDIANTAEVRKLTKRDLNRIREILKEKKEALLQGIRREMVEYRNRPKSSMSDEADKAVDASDEVLSFEIASTSDEELENIEAALQKINKGTYGDCEVCGEPIPPSRLKILPFAITCVACRGESERKRKRTDLNAIWDQGSDDSEGV